MLYNALEHVKKENEVHEKEEVLQYYLDIFEETFASFFSSVVQSIVGGCL